MVQLSAYTSGDARMDVYTELPNDTSGSVAVLVAANTTFGLEARLATPQISQLESAGFSASHEPLSPFTVTTPSSVPTYRTVVMLILLGR